MSGPRRNILIIGGDSQIARGLASWHRSQGDRAVTTSRHLTPASDTIGLDLSNFSDDQIPSGFEYAYLCGGITSLHDCETQPEKSARVNIEGTLQALHALAAHGTFTVFFSTNLVFDGSKPHMPAEAPMNPKCEYGRQKAEVETVARREGLPVAVLRLSKVLTPTSTLLGSWMQSLSQGAATKPFFDMPMAPITIDATVAAAAEITQAKQTGIHQLSASHDISYADATNYLASLLRASAALVQPVSAREILGAHAHIPLFTSLEHSRLQTNMENNADPYAALKAFFHTMVTLQMAHRVS